uniref:Uncharacterized protein n=1 Tax=Cannabis sativa TaxID=3483 RepID=A0A803PRA9_CANSA
MLTTPPATPNVLPTSRSVGSSLLELIVYFHCINNISDRGQSQTSKEAKEVIDYDLDGIITEATKDDKLLEASWKLRNPYPLIEEDEIQERYTVAYPMNAPQELTLSEEPMKDFIDRVDEIIRIPSNLVLSSDTITEDPFLAMSFPHLREYDTLEAKMWKSLSEKITKALPRWKAPKENGRAMLGSGITQVGHFKQQTLAKASLLLIMDGTTQEIPETTIASNESLDWLMFPKKGGSVQANDAQTQREVTPFAAELLDKAKSQTTVEVNKFKKEAWVLVNQVKADCKAEDELYRVIEERDNKDDWLVTQGNALRTTLQERTHGSSSANGPYKLGVSSSTLSLGTCAQHQLVYFPMYTLDMAQTTGGSKVSHQISRIGELGTRPFGKKLCFLTFLRLFKFLVSSQHVKERDKLFHGLQKEFAKGCNPSSNTLHILVIFGRWHVNEGFDLHWVCFNSLVVDDKSQELPRGDTKRIFFRIKFHSILLED